GLRDRLFVPGPVDVGRAREDHPPGRESGHTLGAGSVDLELVPDRVPARGRIVREEDQSVPVQRKVGLPPPAGRDGRHVEIGDPPRILDADGCDGGARSQGKTDDVTTDEPVGAEHDEPKAGEVREPGWDVRGTRRSLAAYQFRTGPLRPTEPTFVSP